MHLGIHLGMCFKELLKVVYFIIRLLTCAISSICSTVLMSLGNGEEEGWLELNLLWECVK